MKFLGNINLMNSADIYAVRDSLLKRFEDGLRIGLGEENNMTKQSFKKIPVAKNEKENENEIRVN